jgi:hypothetical protein
MKASRPAIVVGGFAGRGQAEAAIDELLHAGFRHDQLGLAAPGGPMTEATTPTEKREQKAAGGAVSGAVAGGVAGAVGGALATAVFPAAGIVIAGTYLAGILAGTVGGAAAGAALGSYFGPFVAMGMTEEEAGRYTSALKEDRTIVVVKPEERWAEAKQILNDHAARAS